MNNPAAKFMNKLLEMGNALEPAKATNSNKTFFKNVVVESAKKLSNKIGQELSLRKQGRLSVG